MPNELKLTIADNLGVGDINALVCTSRAMNRLLTPYMYRRAKNLCSKSRPFFLRAVDSGSLTAVRRFIEVGTSVNMSDTTDLLRPTSLHSCVQGGNLGMTQLLIKNGANISAVNRLGLTPLHYAVRRRRSSESLVRLLLDAGADLFVSSMLYHTVLFTATMYGTTSIVQLLLHRGAIPTIHEHDGATPLHGAASHGTAATVQLILKAGVNIEATNSSGETPLHMAAKFGKADNVDTLLQWGANVNATSRIRSTPLLEAVLYFGTCGEKQAAAHRILHVAPPPDGSCWKGTEACVPSCRFAQYNQRTVDILLYAGADILATSNNNISPLRWAVVHSYGTE
jgi:hypothetical protein